MSYEKEGPECRRLHASECICIINVHNKKYEIVCSEMLTMRIKLVDLALLWIILD